MFYPPTDELVRTDAPVRRRVGHELEFHHADGSSYPVAAMRVLQMDGVATPPLTDTVNSDHDAIHPYRCRCTYRDDYPLHPTSDATVEWIIGGSSGVLFGSDRYYEAVDILCRYAHLHRFGPFDTFGPGGHVHVSTNNPSTTYQAVVSGYTRFFQEMTRLARGDLARVRPYQRDQGASTLLRPKDYGTIEFRHWNGSRNPETIHVSAAVSVGIIEAVEANRSPSEYASLLDWISPYLNTRMQTAVEARLSPSWRPRAPRTGRFVAVTA